MVNCINLIIEMSPRFVLGRENVPCVAEVVNRSLKADCTDYNFFDVFVNLSEAWVNLIQVWVGFCKAWVSLSEAWVSFCTE